MIGAPAFFLRNIIYVYFFYGLAFFALGLMVILETTRGSEFRFARALRPLAVFGIVHGAHEWYEMFQIVGVNQGVYTPGIPDEILRTVLLVTSFLALLAFGARLLPDAEQHPRLTYYRVIALACLWLAGVILIIRRFAPPATEILAAADVLARYSLGIPASILAAWALLRERHDFHARGMSAYGRDLLWAALAFFLYGVGQGIARPSLLFPSQYLNTTLFLRSFGVPVQVFRGLAAVAIVVTLGRALRAFEMESRIRLARANKARLEAQAAALTAQEQRMAETETLNAQLSTTARELSAMVEMARILSSTIDLERLLADGLYQIVHSFDGASIGVIFLKRPDGGLELAGKYQRPQSRFVPTTLPPLTFTVKAAIDSERPAGAALDGLVVPLDEASLVGVKSYRTLAVPLHAKGQLFGGLVMTCAREQQPFGRAELNLLIAFGQQLAASVENAGLYRALQEREERLEQLVRQLVNAQEAERARIARELHDDTGQKLSALVMGLAAVESFLGVDPQRALPTVHELRAMAEQSIDELRNIMANLRPPQLDDLGLSPALRWLIQRYEERNPTIHFNLALERNARRLPPEYETVLFRVTQEALTNVVRHSQAGRVDVELCYEPQLVRLRVADDGVGFEEEGRLRRREGGWGLVGIRERVALVQGHCEIVSQRGRGTCVMVELPLRKRVEEKS